MPDIMPRHYYGCGYLSKKPLVTQAKVTLYVFNFVTNQKLVLTIELTILDGSVSYLLRHYKRRSIPPALVAQHSVRRIVILYLLGFGIEIQRSPQAVRGVCQVG